jgi:trigger factor
MQVTVQKLSPVLVEFAVEVPQDKVAAEIERAYKELSRTAKIRGYRPGKAPRDVLTHVYGGQVLQTVTQKLVDDTLPKALAEKSVSPIATLSIAPSKLESKASFSYKARFEVTPDIESVKFDGFPAKKPSTKVTDETITAQLESLREDHSTLKAPEPARAAKTGDTVVIDFTLDVDGKHVAEADGKDVQAELGKGALLKELDDALVGVSLGDKKDVELSFPDTHNRADFRGKKGVFHVTVTEVKERVLPGLDDDFAKDVGFDTLDLLKADVKDKLGKQLEQRAEDALAEQLVVELCKANPVPVPPSLVQRQSEITLQELAAQARRQNQRLQMNEELQQRLQADSEIKVRAGLLMAAIAKSEGVQIVDDDLEKAYVELAEQTGKNVARLKVEYRDQKKREVLLGMILEDKILDIIEAKATITEE